MTSAISASSVGIAEDFVRLVPEYARLAFLDLLQTELRGRSLPDDEMHRLVRQRRSILGHRSENPARSKARVSETLLRILL